MKLPPKRRKGEGPRPPQEGAISVHSEGSQVQSPGPRAQLCRAQTRCQAAMPLEAGSS